MVLSMKKYVLIFSLLCTWMVSPVLGQNRLLKYADKQLGLENYAHAAEVYTQAYQRKPKYTTAKNAAQAFTTIQDYNNSFEWWEKTVAFPEAERTDYSAYLQAALKLGKLAEVEDILSKSGFTEADFAELDFDLIRKLQTGTARVALLPVEGVNSDGSDQGLKLDESGTKYFSSDRGTITPTQKKGIRFDAKSSLPSGEKSNFNERPFFQIYQQRENGEATTLKSDLADATHVADFAPMPSKDLVFYTVLRDVRKIKKKRAYTIQPEIYFGKRGDNGQISGSKPFPLNNFTVHGVQNPFVDEQAGRIYFASDMAGGVGGFDLYYVTFDQDLNFGSPVNLGPGVNTLEDESHPYIKGGKLYFSSKGHPGVGGMDIFIADQIGGVFSDVQNLGVPFNSTRDDFAFYVASDGKRYLSSDREGGLGMDDIYFIQDLYKILLAKVLDCDGVIIAENLDVRLDQANTRQMVENRRLGNGEISADLEPEQDFWLQISKPGYFSIQDSSLTTIGLEGDTLRREYRLARIPYGLQVWSDIVYYDLDKSYLKTQAEQILGKLADLMLKHDFLNLKVTSHTDARASDSYNERLSEKRAKAVSDFLVAKGVAADRIALAWFGEEQLVNDCGDGKPCPENLHQQNRRSELTLEAFSDKNKQYSLPSGFELEDPCDLSPFTNLLSKDLITVPNIYFDFDKAAIRPQHQTDLDRVSFVMKKMENLQLYLAGHTDQRGNEAYNMKLAERRAKAVMDYLVSRGVDASRLQYEWFGKSRPIHDCGTKACTEAMHQENRRTELILKGN
jgi:outer membrane protein OmpA-like peptidoglycan-associated protein/tetratricopeptide (TPR) repeat protein